MKASFLFLLGISLSFHACKESSVCVAPVFKETISLEGVKLPHSIEGVAPGQMVMIDTSLFLFRADNKSVAQIISPNNGEKIGSFSHIGRGANEYITPSFIGSNPKDSTLQMLDVSQRIIRGYKWGRASDGEMTLVNTSNAQAKFTESVFGGVVLPNSFFVGKTTFAPNGSLTLFDSSYQTKSTFCNPLNITMTEKSSYGPECLDSYEDNVVVAYQNFGYIACYQVDQHGEVALQWNYMIAEPKYEQSPNFHFIEDQNLVGFFDVKMTEKYVYGLYYGEPWPDTYVSPQTVLVFDRKGKPVAKIRLNSGGGRMAITQDDSTLFLVGRETQDSDLSVFKFDLSSVFH